MLSNLGSYAFRVGDVCFPTWGVMLSESGMHAFRERPCSPRGATGATGVFRAATGVAAAPPRGANPSFATEVFRAATAVAAAPQRGANPPFATEGGLGGGAL